MQHVVMFSGGVGSYCAARRVVRAHGARNTTLLFCDTMIEDEDSYRFLEEGAAKLRANMVRLSNGEDVWDVFNRTRMLGNTQFDPCSRVLKREASARWLKNNHTPETAICYVGIDWTEKHRYDRIQKRNLPWVYRAPLCEPPLLSKKQLFEELKEDGIRPPRLYSYGFAHGNCGGFCVKAGHAHFKTLLKSMPDRYRYHEKKEEELRAKLKGDHAILRDRSGGTTKPMTLRQLRERVESNAPATEQESFDWGGCGCFSGAV